MGEGGNGEGRGGREGGREEEGGEVEEQERARGGNEGGKQGSTTHTGLLPLPPLPLSLPQQFPAGVHVRVYVNTLAHTFRRTL